MGKLQDVIKEVEQETERFLKKLAAYKKRLKSDATLYCSKESASLKRSAQDLKRELTRITQSHQW